MSLSGRFFPESFNDVFSWEMYDKLPKVANVDVIPFTGMIKLNRQFSAWHQGSIGVFPHTKQYRLLRSILENDIKELNKVIQEDKNIINEQFVQKYGYTPLTMAATLDRYALIQYLVLKGADINLKDGTGNTPLMHAVKNWQFESIKTIVETCGADLNIQDQYNYNVIDKAQQRELHAISSYLQDQQQKQQKIIENCKKLQNKKLKKQEKIENQEFLEKNLNNLPKFNIQFKFEKQFQDPMASITTFKKQYNQKATIYPFNDIDGTYLVNLLTYKRRNSEDKIQD